MERYIPILFLPQIVRAVVEPGRPGAYVLGAGPRFKAGYIGRSDSCLRSRLASHNHLYGFDYFIFRYANDAAEAYQFECEAYHALMNNGSSVANKYHPAAPGQSGLRCSYCGFAEDVRRSLRLAA